MLTALTPIGMRLPEMADLERYVKDVMGRGRLVQRYGVGPCRAPVKVKDGRGRRNACAWINQIEMPCALRTKWVVLHELAHVICDRVEGEMRYQEHTPGHGWRFAEIYLYLVKTHLVKTHLGQDRHDALKAAFKAHHVRFRKPVRRIMTPEQRAACCARLALARAARAA
jgi:putative metallohydrolase (TIGR04338 family)